MIRRDHHDQKNTPLTWAWAFNKSPSSSSTFHSRSLSRYLGTSMVISGILSPTISDDCKDFSIKKGVLDDHHHHHHHHHIQHSLQMQGLPRHWHITNHHVLQPAHSLVNVILQHLHTQRHTSHNTHPLPHTTCFLFWHIIFQVLPPRRRPLATTSVKLKHIFQRHY
jgi:hypothetical protein